MTALAAPSFDVARGVPRSRTVVASLAFASLIGLLGLQHLALWSFLGFAPLWIYPPAILAFGAIAVVLVRQPGWAIVDPPSRRTVAICALFALVLLLLGGEGRLFYANDDWRVRDAVLRDLVVYPWPFAYDVGATPQILRAPLGMYLLPALTGKALGLRAAEWALLIQNAALLTVVLSLGATLFATMRDRWIAVIVFFVFSGMDVIGRAFAGLPLDGHLEWWMAPQYSSHVTQMFWVPQHGLVGWLGALLYLLWRERRIPLVVLTTPMPLLALLSPLSLIGMIPFVALAGIETVRGRELRMIDVVLPLAATMIALPSLLFLMAGSGSVGSAVAPLGFGDYIEFETLEVFPFLVCVALLPGRFRFGVATLALVAASLLVAPYGRIGPGQDFVMRASIPALAILALLVANALIQPPAAERKFWRWLLTAVLVIGSVTPLSEIVRALKYPRSPATLCSYFGVVPGGAPLYVAPLAALPRAIAPTNPTLIKPHDPADCWSGPWPSSL